MSLLIDNLINFDLKFINNNYNIDDNIFSINNKIPINYKIKFEEILLKMMPSNRKYFNLMTNPKECSIYDFLLVIDQLDKQSNSWYTLEVANWLLYIISHYIKSNKNMFDTLVNDYDHVDCLENLLSESYEKLNNQKVVLDQKENIINLQDKVINELMVVRRDKNVSTIEKIIDEYNDYKLINDDKQTINNDNLKNDNFKKIEQQLVNKVFINKWLTKNYEDKCREYAKLCEDFKNQKFEVERLVEENDRYEQKLNIELNRNEKSYQLFEKNKKLMEENKQLMNDIILIGNKNKENEKKLNFCKEIYHGQIMIEKEKREREIKEKEKGI